MGWQEVMVKIKTINNMYIYVCICTYILFLSLLKQNELCLSCPKKPLKLLVYWAVMKKNVASAAKILITPSG